MRSRHRRFLACLVGAASLTAACGGGEGSTADPRALEAAGPPGDGAKAVGTAASILRANLTGLLQHHVFLTGLATGAVVAGQDPAPASAVIDQNSVSLSFVIGAVYGEERSAQFLDVWRRHSASLLEFAAGSATADVARVDKAKAELETYKSDVALFLNTVNPNLAKDAMAEDQKEYLGGLQSAITAQAKKDPKSVDKLKDAAEHMPRTAALLAAGIVKQAPKAFGGKADSSAATLRSGLTSELQEHVYLLAGVTGTVLGQGDTKEPVAALDASSTELAQVIASAYGDDAGRQFLIQWRRHIGLVVDYARGYQAGDQAAVTKAAAELGAYRNSFSAFLHAANPNLTTDDLSANLGAHLNAVLGVVDAQAAGDPASVAALRAAGEQAAGTATLLSSGLATQFPSRFS